MVWWATIDPRVGPTDIRDWFPGAGDASSEPAWRERKGEVGQLESGLSAAKTNQDRGRRAKRGSLMGVLRNPWDRLRQGIGGQVFAQTVGLVVQLGGVPLFLYFWGVSLYGEWLVLAAFPAWLVFSNLGFTHATLNEATMCVARGDLQAARNAFRTTWVFLTGASFTIAAVLAALAASAPLASWFGFSTLGDGDARIIVILLLLQVLVYMQAELAAAGLFGAGRYGLHAFLGASTRLAGFLLVALAVALGGGPLAAAAVMAGAECAGFALMVSVARRHGPWMRYGVSGASRSAFLRLAPPSFGFAGFIAGNALAIQGSLLVISAVLGPAAVAVFATLRLPARGLAILGNIGFAILRPEMTMAYGAGETARLRRLYEQAMQFSLWLGVAGFIGLMFLGPPIVELWTGGRVVAEQPLFGWLLAGGAALLLWTGAATVLHATNRHARIAWLYVAVSGIGLAAAAMGAAYAGPEGAAAALAVSEIVVFALALKQALAFVEERLRALVAAALRPPTGILDRFRRCG